MLACRIKSGPEQRLRVALALIATERSVCSWGCYIYHLSCYFVNANWLLCSRRPDISASHLSDRHMTPSKSMRVSFYGVSAAVLFPRHQKLSSVYVWCGTARVICVMDGCCMPNCIFWYHKHNRQKLQQIHIKRKKLHAAPCQLPAGVCFLLFIFHRHGVGIKCIERHSACF